MNSNVEANIVGTIEADKPVMMKGRGHRNMSYIRLKTVAVFD